MEIRTQFWRLCPLRCEFELLRAEVKGAPRSDRLERCMGLGGIEDPVVCPGEPTENSVPVDTGEPP